MKPRTMTGKRRVSKSRYRIAANRGSGGGLRRSFHSLWQFLAALRQQRRQVVRREPRLVEDQATHLVQHVVRQVVAGPALFKQAFLNVIETVVAKLVRLPGDVPLVHAKQMGYLALAHAVTQPKTEDQHVAVAQLAKRLAGCLAERFVPTAIGAGGERQGQVVFRQRLHAAALAELRDMPVLEDAD